MRILILLSLVCCSTWAQDFPDEQDLSKKEFLAIFDDIKREVAQRTPWERIDTWFVSLQGPEISDDDVRSDFYKEVRSQWASSSAKTFLAELPIVSSDEQEETASKHPAMRLQIRRILEEVVFVRVWHGYPLAGGTFELVYRKEAERWKLANVLRGGIH